MAPMPGIYSAWAAWARHGILPHPGAYLEQPLKTLVLFAAFDICAAIRRLLDKGEGTAIKEMTFAQLDLHKWLTE